MNGIYVLVLVLISVASAIWYVKQAGRDLHDNSNEMDSQDITNIENMAKIKFIGDTVTESKLDKIISLLQKEPKQNQTQIKQSEIKQSEIKQDEVNNEPESE